MDMSWSGRLTYVSSRNATAPAATATRKLSSVDGAGSSASNDDVSVQVYESRANIRIKVGGSLIQSVSMDRIADIAIEAVLAELRKEAS